MSTTGNGLATGVVQSGVLPGSGLSAGAQLAAASQLSQSSQHSAGAPLSSGGVQLSNSSQLASGNVQLSNSGHHPSSGSLNTASISSNNTHSTHTSVQTSPMTQGKMSGSTLDNRIHHQGSSQVNLYVCLMTHIDWLVSDVRIKWLVLLFLLWYPLPSTHSPQRIKQLRASFFWIPDPISKPSSMLKIFYHGFLFSEPYLIWSRSWI